MSADTMTATEEWRSVPGWEGLYSVSSYGRIRSEDRAVLTSQGVIRRVDGKVLAGSRHSHGYLQVRLMRPGTKQWVRLHRLVALVFLGEPTGPMVLHHDDNPANNRVSNLAYGDASQNAYDKVRNGNWSNGSSRRSTCANGHDYTPGNTYITAEGARSCRSCKRDQNRAYVARKKGQAS